jgi:hypothetical protein
MSTLKTKATDAESLEAKLRRLNNLVRQRRAQLARLAACPHKECECRAVWRQVIEKELACQVGRVRSEVRAGSRPRAKAKPGRGKAKLKVA